MSKQRYFRRAVVALAVAGSTTAALATNGYFAHGYGMKAKGMAGAAVASTDDAFAGANNPASAAWAGNRLDLGVDLFMPKRSASSTASSWAANSESNQFLVPEFGWNKAINDKLAFNLTVYGNGGMNTNYPTNNGFGTGRMGVDLMQLIVAPTLAYKFAPDHSVGVSPLFIQQRFKASGLQNFGVNDTGYDTSSGTGLRIGYLGKISGTVSVGVSYSPKTDMSKFDQYKGLFAEQGDFDIPENYTIGASFMASPAVRVAFDYQKIGYSGVRAIANASNTGGTLGTANGPGFGWSDVNVYKLGVEWKQSGDLTLRAGLNVGDNPIRSRDVTFNILAPGVITTHYTLGGTYAVAKDKEFTVAYMYAPQNSVTGPTSSLLGGGGNDTIKMSQQSLGVQFSWKY